MAILSQPLDIRAYNIVIATLGVLVLILHLTYIILNEMYLTGPVWLLPLGLSLVSLLSIGLVYSAGWLAVSELTVRQGRRVTIWCFAGLIGALALTFWPIFYQRIVGVVIEDPIFILLISSGLGANAGVVAGISHIRSEQRFEEAQQALDTLKFLNRLLRHNVLNAVNIIQGNAEILIANPSSDSVEERARTIQYQSDQISTLIQNTKAIIQQMDREADLERIDLTSIVNAEIETAQKTYPEASIEGDLAQNVAVCADSLISAMVENLLANAVVHNDQETPRVKITLTTRDETAVLEIADNGPGIPDDDKETVTEPGEHGDQGLGLYLVATLVDRYDGSLRITDNEPRGTVVTIELPRIGSS